MKELIQQKLLELEKEEGITILYACESGSRAWGFASEDSDYDVRFIYKRTADSYLSINDVRDVVELPVNEVLDIGGWDVKKALKLFRSSNPPLYEWLQSPIMYMVTGGFYEELKSLADMYFSCRAGMHHYTSMARNAFEHDLKNPEVKIKKYFYALRPLLASMWIDKYGAVPPMEFAKLRVLIDDAVWQNRIDALLIEKANATEKTLMPQDKYLHDFIETSLNYCLEAGNKYDVKHTEIDTLDKLFRKTVL